MTALSSNFSRLALALACAAAFASTLAHAGYEHRVSLKDLKVTAPSTGAGGQAQAQHFFALAPTSLSAAQEGIAYSFDVSALASSDDPDYASSRVSFSASGLPAGLTLTSTGVLSGVPTQYSLEGSTFTVSAQYGDKTAQQSYTLVVGSPEDPYFSKVGLLLPLNQNLTDYSLSPSSGITGNVSFASLSPYGGHALFEGSQLVRIPYAAKMDFSKEVDFTLEMRVKLDTPVTGWTSLYTQVEPTGGYRPISVDLSPAGQLTVSFGNSGLTNWGLSLSAPYALPVGAWQNIAVSKQEEVVRVFVNGTVVASGTYAGALPYWGGDYLIGAGLKNGSRVYPFKGAVDEVRVTRGIARMTGPYTVQPYPFSTR